ncbi:hypothetical protein Tco_0955838 [Tanacetum coccineum]|uniref:Secreted protein n=1 Tax=Tanacetum coccineum TaxID=301880 RepID=A0ABQ5E8G7_9ASTR
MGTRPPWQSLMLLLVKISRARIYGIGQQARIKGSDWFSISLTQKRKTKTHCVFSLQRSTGRRGQDLENLEAS